MQIVEKIPLKNSSGVNIGTVVKLNGIIGYETPTVDFIEYNTAMVDLETLHKSDIIAIDATNLDSWNTLGLKSIYPRLISINKELVGKGKTPIVIIGDRTKDVYDAALERYPNTEAIVPWLENVQEFINKYNLG